MSFPLGERIKRLREQAGMKIGDFAMIVGINRDHQSRLENGHQTNPGFKQLEMTAKALGISLPELFDFEKFPQPKKAEAWELNSEEKVLVAKLRKIKSPQKRKALERLVDAFLKATEEHKRPPPHTKK